MSIGIFADNSYFRFPEKPNRTPLQRLTLLATTLILWSVFLVGLALLFAPAYAAPVINPSVEHGPIWCQNSLTGWICEMTEGKIGATGAQGPQGMMNQTPNMTLTLPTTYYLHNATTTANSSTFHIMRRYYPTGAEDSNTTTLSIPNQDYLLAQFITDEGDPNLAALPPGDRKWFTYVSTDSLATGTTHLQYKLYAYHTNGTKSLIYSFQGQNLYDTAITRMVDQYTLASAVPMNTSDRFIMEYYANTTSAADRTVTMYWDDNSHVSKIESPITLTGLQGPKGDTGTAINESYAYLPGRADGQVLTGGTGANDDTGMEPALDHIHMLVKATPSTDLEKVFNTLKGISSRYLRQEFPEIKNLLWGDSFWSDSKFIATTGQVMKYVESQNEPRKK